LTGDRINYQSIGSGGGIAQLKAGTVDFGGSDAPLTKGELDSLDLIQFPMIMGGVVPIIHVKGIRPGILRLNPAVLADLFSGKIKFWDDIRIKEINPDIELPHKRVTVVYRADGSGTTWIFSRYLSRISDEWRSNSGSGLVIRWPAGIGSRGNEGVSVTVQRIEGTIGYVEYAYALQNNLTTIMLQNEEGNFVLPTLDSFKETASRARWDGESGYFHALSHLPGQETWPIFGVSFILMKKTQTDPGKKRIMLDFFNWCYTYGKDMAHALHYIPIPDKVVRRIRDLWQSSLKLIENTDEGS
jgi:phosphate transport system substrate-binding protein